MYEALLANCHSDKILSLRYNMHILITNKVGFYLIVCRTVYKLANFGHGKLTTSRSAVHLFWQKVNESKV